MNFRPWLTVTILALAGFVTAARAGGPQTVSSVAACRALIHDLDVAVDAAAVLDQGPYRLPEFPYLRLNRFLADFRLEARDLHIFSPWVSALAELDRKARGLELQNLPETERSAFGVGLGRRLDDCRERLIESDLSAPEGRERLLHAARVPDEYEGSWRLLGLYPITAPFVGIGVDHWQESARAQFKEVPVTRPVVQWQRSSDAGLDEAPLTQQDVARILKSSRDALGIPRPDDSELRRLFARFSPDWGIETEGPNDRIGRPIWRGHHIDIDTEHPVEYHRVSHTRFGGRTLLQLNYIVWFPARSGDDIYAGAIDGLDWRVTLDDDGRPLISDVIHNCGCYETFFPSEKIHLREPHSKAYIEPPLVFPGGSEAGRTGIRVAFGTHLIRHVEWRDGRDATRTLTVGDYDELRSLPNGDGRKSMFGPYGIVVGSERRERFLLWPMGVRSPGAMRQWGRHAIAFIGRRHFDDPGLLDDLFAYR